MKIYTQGSFDVLHAGHINFLRQCAFFGNVTVALLTDQAYRNYRGYDPVVPFEQRRTLLESVKFVTGVIESVPERTKGEILTVRPSIVAVGSDWASKNIYKQYELSQEWLDHERIQLIFLPYTAGVSSTDIKERCKNI